MEIALTILCYKMNVLNMNKSDLKPKELGTVSNQSCWKKDFTVDFSRDRKVSPDIGKMFGM